MKRVIAVGGVVAFASALLAVSAAPASAAERLVANPGVQASDFSMAVAPSSGSVDPGYLIETTVTTDTTSGGPQAVALSASGLPPNTAAYFYPESVTSGESSRLRISTNTWASPGVYPIVVTGTGASGTHSATYTLTVYGPAGCAQTNVGDAIIPDGSSSVESGLLISHCAGDASAASTVEVHIVHPNIGDLIVDLVAPDGSVYPLHDRAGGSADNLDQTYQVDLSGEASEGRWRLSMRDVVSQETGYLDTWTLDLRNGTCHAGNSADLAIPDRVSVTSSVTIEGCAGNASTTSAVEVHIVHPRIGDLLVVLVAPNGLTYTLHQYTGGGADNIDQTYPVDLSGQARDGTWDLVVYDSMTSQVGTLTGWRLSL
ncbi:MAG TPA: proprotein convertase P-domain-containing protein [Micromonosporaceae bacterium]